MTCNKPAHIKDELWAQHLRWLDLVGHESRANRLKREQERVKRKRSSSQTTDAHGGE